MSTTSNNNLPAKRGLDDHLVDDSSIPALLQQMAKNLAPINGKDQRSLTSPGNGIKGGRPNIEITQISNEIAYKFKDNERNFLLKQYHGRWHQFNGRFYEHIGIDDIANPIMAFLRHCHPKNATIHCQKNVLAQLAASDLGHIPSTAPFPCWLNKVYDPANGWLIMKNQIVNLLNMSRFIRGESIDKEQCILTHTPTLFSTFAVDYNFDIEAQCPKWLQYLNDVQPNPDDRLMLQKLCGLSLIPETRFNVVFFLFGDGGTGKSTFLHVLERLVGTNNVCCLPLSQFSNKFKTWELTCNLLNIVGDLPTENEHGSISQVEGMLKDVCDGNPIPTEQKGRNTGKANAIARCIFATNSLPRFTDKSNAMWDRLRIIPFNQRIRHTDKENPDLRKELAESELPGIFLWALLGLAQLQSDRRFPEHSEGIATKDSHRKCCDHEALFLDEHCEIGSDNDYIGTQVLYNRYREWTKNNGYYPCGELNFAKAVERCFKIHKGRKTIMGKKPMVYSSLKLKESSDWTG